jgi:hypothetical protein
LPAGAGLQGRMDLFVSRSCPKYALRFLCCQTAALLFSTVQPLISAPGRAGCPTPFCPDPILSRAACAQPEPVCARFSSPCAPLHEPGPRADKCPPRVHPPTCARTLFKISKVRAAQICYRENGAY